MREGREWEECVHAYISSLPNVEVEQFGQAMLGPLSRRALFQKPTLLRWLPDFLLCSGDTFVWLEAKKSIGVTKYGNHSCEDASTAALHELATATGHAAVYAFWHQGETPGFMSIDTWINYREARPFMGSGSGTPFHVASHRHCQPTIQSSLRAKVGIS
jgi:hypothetical protein